MLGSLPPRVLQTQGSPRSFGERNVPVSLNRSLALAVAALLTLGLAGCGGSEKPDESSQSQAAAPVATAPVAEAPSGPPPPLRDASLLEPDPNFVPPEQPPKETFVEATADTVGTKGRDYGGGIVTEPVSQYFRLADKVKMIELDSRIKSFEIQHGRKPKSHEEFVSGVLNAGPRKFELPSLRGPKDEYFWDADQGKLMVRTPK